MTNKYKYFIANWKMYGTFNSIKSLNRVINFIKKFKKNKFKVVYCPPYILLKQFSDKLKKLPIDVGAQNCHFEENSAAFTGSINSKMLIETGCKYVIIGHSENRQEGDTDNIINKKIKSCTGKGLKVIFCIGETLVQKRKKITKAILKKQIKLGLKNIKSNNIIIAYEPVWSIGTGIIPKIFELEENISFIKNVSNKLFKKKKFKILYGGSVNQKNVNNLKKIKLIDGFLIGGASQKANKFIDIIKKTYN